jgi:hypothetical protein
MKLSFQSRPRAGRDDAGPGGWRLTDGRSGSARSDGIALIITLILLAVITFMAITFLYISTSQRKSVTITTDQNIARFAADTARERAIAEALAPILGFTNQWMVGLTVSTNFINAPGYIAGNRSLTNVNYSYPNGTPLAGNDIYENLSHLLFNPRVPVWLTNRATRSNEFRFYVDLNRNRRFEPTGWLAETNSLNLPIVSSNRFVTNYYTGDPQWVGQLERPDLPHSPSNRFIARWAFMMVPASKALDINYVHNYAKPPPTDPRMLSGDFFLRNMGAGTWEMNLAGFLVDLNTNGWLTPAPLGYGSAYVYDPITQPRPGPNQGAAFDDALSILRFRYGGNSANLWNVPSLFGQSGSNAFALDGFDGYSSGPVMTNTAWASWGYDLDRNRLRNPWSGSDNPNHLFTTQDLFDKNKIAPPGAGWGFADRLFMVGTNVSSYNRYTFYRLLSQLGTDSGSEMPVTKMNLNYDNLQQSNIYTRATASTNFFVWTPTGFFTNAAARLLLNSGYSPDGADGRTNARVNVSHIQIWPTNYYTASIHRLLQVAANLYDASSTRTFNLAGETNGFPTVFRPHFTHLGSKGGGLEEIYISGWTEVTNIADVISTNNVMIDLTDSNSRDRLKANDMVYGVPLVVGARKGFPNFNEFAMETKAEITRKMEFRREGRTQDGPINETNVMYTMVLTNTFGLEAWNSYSNAYPRSLEMRLAVEMFAFMTNRQGEVLFAVTNPPRRTFLITNYSAGSWRGFTNNNYAAASFRVPLHPSTNNFLFLTNSTYNENTRRFMPLTGTFIRHPNRSEFPIPEWYLNLRTRVRYILIDRGVNRIVDYANLDSIEPVIDITTALMDGGQCGGGLDGKPGSMWCTNRPNADIRTPTFGILNQMAASGGNQQIIGSVDWRSSTDIFPPGLDRAGAIDFFRSQFDQSPLTYSQPFPKTNVFYTPYNPTRQVLFITSWTANDPLVHYTLTDLTDLRQPDRLQFDVTKYSTVTNLGLVNKRFEPWGGNPNANSGSPTKTDLAVKDPGVTKSSDWNFPTNKFPNIGTIGRVHRGTPWQTVYLKSPLTTNQWGIWTGHQKAVTNYGQFLTNLIAINAITNEAGFSHPIQDRYIVDLFTASLSENATRGQLSINQTELAAWSAVLSGVNVLTNTSIFTYSNTYIAPAGIYSPTSPPPLLRIVEGINRFRTNYPANVYHRLGEILAVPELTVASPFLNTNRPAGLTDEMYERIPQQILGLLKGGEAPRFVIYSWGQALKPAEKSLVTSGPYFGLCTNYQITAEVATRAVVRIEGLPDYPPPLAAPPAIKQMALPPIDKVRAVVESYNLLPPD